MTPCVREICFSRGTQNEIFSTKAILMYFYLPNPNIKGALLESVLIDSYNQFIKWNLMRTRNGPQADETSLYTMSLSPYV